MTQYNVGFTRTDDGTVMMVIDLVALAVVTGSEDVVQMTNEQRAELFAMIRDFVKQNPES
jgi:tryptophan synthase alpha subunit